MRENIDMLLDLANKGNAEAQKEIGDRYLEGKGCVRNEQQAFQWFQKAAEQGLASAQMASGDCLVDGWGAEENSPLAFGWYLKAAKQGLSEAQHEVGNYYLWNEDGVDQDGSEALKWHRLAADGGSARAIKTLGDYYWSGYQVQMDKSVSRALFKYAASLGWADAQQALIEGDNYRSPFIDFLGLS